MLKKGDIFQSGDPTLTEAEHFCDVMMKTRLALDTLRGNLCVR